MTYVPGNHDDVFRAWCGSDRRGVRIEREAVHFALDGRRILIRHGDEVDPTLHEPGVLTRFSDRVYDVLLGMDRPINRINRILDLDRWSLATAVKRRIPQIRNFVPYYRRAMARRAAMAGADAIVCGHIHRPGITNVDGILYMNDGDWLEHCTALVEGMDGRFQVLEVGLDGVVRPRKATQPIDAACSLAAIAV